jgi:hypothetical protein
LTDHSFGLERRGFEKQRLDWVVEYSLAHGGRRQQRLDFMTEVGGGVIPAGAIEECGTGRRIAFQRRVIQCFDPLPPVRGHVRLIIAAISIKGLLGDRSRLFWFFRAASHNSRATGLPEAISGSAGESRCLPTGTFRSAPAPLSHGHRLLSRPMRLEEGMDLAHRQGNPLFGLFPGEDAHFGVRREHRALSTPWEMPAIWLISALISSNAVSAELDSIRGE